MLIKIRQIILASSLLMFFFPSLSSTYSGPYKQHHPQSNTFDFIIVGGGTAGLVVARRLAEAQNKRFTVLVLEVGDEPRKDSEIPAFAPRFLVDPEVNFIYHSIPQKNAGLQNGGVMTVFAGKMLSGTSNLNYMFFNRGSPRDYDNWGTLTQDPSWNYSSMMKYFKRAETYRGDHPSDQHGFSGPLTITRPRYSPGLPFWLQAGKELGYEIADQNGPQRVSFTAVEFTKKRGRRVNSLSGYINPILRSSPNLKIAINTNATKILFNNNRAIGVCFQTTSPLLRNLPGGCVYVRNEIIVSCGTYGSPLLLLRSGVGPKDDLGEANIPVIKDLPVGLNYEDHVHVTLPFVVNSDRLIMDNDRDLNPGSFEFYERFGDGPYSSTEGITGQAFVASSVAKSAGEGDWADIHLAMVSSKQAYFGTGLVGNDSVNSGEGPMAASVFMNRPKSRGSLKLDPNNPNGPPILDVGYLSDPRDIQIMIDGITELLRIFEETPSYKSIGARFPTSLDLPGCDGFRFRSSEYWDCFVRFVSQTGCHPAGTCQMGRRGDPEAVVDTELRVIGIDGLRVVDASIMPVVTNANTQAPVYGIAEKASDMILRDWEHYY